VLAWAVPGKSPTSAAHCAHAAREDRLPIVAERQLLRDCGGPGEQDFALALVLERDARATENAGGEEADARVILARDLERTVHEPHGFDMLARARENLREVRQGTGAIGVGGDGAAERVDGAVCVPHALQCGAKQFEHGRAGLAACEWFEDGERLLAVPAG
jgi:hypothetical protein